MVTSSPAGEGTLSNLIAAFDEEGFTEHFAVRGGCLVGLEGGARFDASEVVIRHIERFEGASDPDDMSVIYAIETRSGVRGTLTDAFGIYSNPAVGEFICRVEGDPEEVGKTDLEVRARTRPSP